MTSRKDKTRPRRPGARMTKADKLAIDAFATEHEQMLREFERKKAAGLLKRGPDDPF